MTISNRKIFSFFAFGTNIKNQSHIQNQRQKSIGIHKQQLTYRKKNCSNEVIFLCQIFAILLVPFIENSRFFGFHLMVSLIVGFHFS